MQEIYITDLDHTFLRTDLSISDFTRSIWNAYAKHAIMGVATARTYMKTQQFLQGLHINAPMILLDGALIATTDGAIIDTKTINKTLGDAIIDEGSKFGIFPFILALEGSGLHEAFLYPLTCNADQEAVLTRYAKDDNLHACRHIRALERNFKLVYMGQEQLLRDLYEHLHNVFGDTLKYILAPEAYVGCYFLTILHPDADKAHGIRSVSEHVGFDLSRLSVFGDNLNDLGMFALARTAVAVANAHEELKKHAHVVLPDSNDDDGVAKYLQKQMA
jgi:5-amino-6-(5-phospho-D-ribitylamino)uracil phosphatase